MGNMVQNLKALGQAIQGAGADKCYYYPGMKGDILAEAIDSSVKPSLNERNAFEFGYGASLAGARTTVIFKTAGLATCVDSVQHAVIQGVNAGMVVIVLEDTVAASSPEIVDSRLLLDYISTVAVEPRSMENALTHVRSAYALSEKLNVPVLVRLTGDLLSSKPASQPAASTQGSRKKTGKPMPKYRQKMLGAWADRSKVYEAKLDLIEQYVDSVYKPLVKDGLKSLHFGYKEGSSAHDLCVEHYPIAPSLQQAYAKNKVNVHELGSNYARQKLESGGHLRVDNTRALRTYAEPFGDWEKVLQLVDKNDYQCVVGDEGKFTLDSTGLIDVCLCMGASISVCAGMSEVTGSKNLAVIGDFSYLFNGYQSILEAYHRGINMDILLLDDGKASSTGGQSSIASVDLRSIAPYVSASETFNYEGDIPNQLFASDGAGINVYHIKKNG